jgi:hypothetical protein
MHLFFRSRSLETRCAALQAGETAWGAAAPAVRRRLAQLAAAETLRTLMELPPPLRPAPCSAELPTQFIWTATPSLQIRFAAVTEHGERFSESLSEPSTVRAALILAIEENHGR